MTSAASRWTACLAAAVLAAMAPATGTMAGEAPAKPAAPAAAAAAPGKASRRTRSIDWQELLPAAERDQEYAPAPTHDYLGEQGPAMTQVGSSKTNPKLNNVHARVPGFIVPLTMTPEGMVSEFLLVPYFGACIHVPPPPPNQIVYAKPAKPFRLKTIYEPQWVIGTLTATLQTTRVASAAYTIDVEKLEPYED